MIATIEITCYAILGGGFTLATAIVASVAVPFRSREV